MQHFCRKRALSWCYVCVCRATPTPPTSSSGWRRWTRPTRTSPPGWTSTGRRWDKIFSKLFCCFIYSAEHKLIKNICLIALILLFEPFSYFIFITLPEEVLFCSRLPPPPPPCQSWRREKLFFHYFPLEEENSAGNKSRRKLSFPHCGANGADRRCHFCYFSRVLHSSK